VIAQSDFGASFLAAGLAAGLFRSQIESGSCA
jgi:hypothetical protein